MKNFFILLFFYFLFIEHSDIRGSSAGQMSRFEKHSIQCATACLENNCLFCCGIAADAAAISLCANSNPALGVSCFCLSASLSCFQGHYNQRNISHQIPRQESLFLVFLSKVCGFVVARGMHSGFNA